MFEAIGQAQKAKAEGNFPFGAVIVQNNEIVATGHCLELTERDVTKHAELIAISNACKLLGRMSLNDYVLVASGEPCNMCASAAFQAEIGTVIIGASRLDLRNFFRQREIGIREFARDAGHQIKIVSGVLREDAMKLFEGVTK